MLLNIATFAAILIFLIMFAIELHNAMNGDRWDKLTATPIYERESEAIYRSAEDEHRRLDPADPKAYHRGKQSHPRGFDSEDAVSSETLDSSTDTDTDSGDSDETDPCPKSSTETRRGIKWSEH